MELSGDLVGKGKQKANQQAASRPQDFLFVDSSKTAKSSRQGRRNARSFVMQKARRERPWSTSKHTTKQVAFRRSPDTASSTSIGTPELAHTPFTSSTPSPPGILPSPSFMPQDFPLMKETVCHECQMIFCWPGQSLCLRCMAALRPSALTDEPDNSMFDPFGTFPVEMTPQTSELLDHFFYQMVPGVIAIDVRHRSDLIKSSWFGAAKNDPGFMHSLLCSAALHFWLMGKGSFDNILHHRYHAISWVNATLSNSDTDTKVSDASIGAVFNLLCLEESLQRPDFPHEKLNEDPQHQSMVHLKGLRQMVEMRGGLQAINSNRCLQAFILWHSTARAVASFEAPYLSTINFPSHPYGYHPTFSNHLLDYCRIAQLQESLISLVEKGLVLIADLNVWFSDPGSPLNPVDIQNFSCVLESSILDWLRKNKTLYTPFEQALGIALLIFTVRTTEALTNRSVAHHLHYVASVRLQTALCVTTKKEWASCPDLLLWILSIGAISAEGSQDERWYISQASYACEKFSVDSGRGLLERLHRGGWVSFKLDEAALQLWNNIVKLRQDSFYFADPNLTGPLQLEASEADFMTWKSVSRMSGSQGQSIVHDELPLGLQQGFYDLGIAYILRQNNPEYTQ